MLRSSRNSRWLLLTAFVAASCSQEGSHLAGPSASKEPLTSPGSGNASGLAAGDVKNGPGALVIDDVRMDRQNSSGASILRQYANPGETYRMEVGETIELWVEWDRNIGKIPAGTIPNNPRLTVNWGEGETDFVNCGSCRLTHTYPRAGVFTVKVTLDDRLNTTVERTFFLNTEATKNCGAPATASFDSNSFNDTETPTLSPVEGANRVTFSCPQVADVRAQGESSFVCYAHSHGGPLDILVDVHDANTGSWIQVFTRPLDNGEDFGFNGLSLTFPQTRVDRVRLRSVPGQNQTYHGWSSASLTVSCQ